MRYLIILLFMLFSGPVLAAAPRVESFSPQGSQKDIRQVQVRFSDPMVRFGDSGRHAPFTIQCAVGGQGHWIDPRQWVYDFSRDLPAGQRCSFGLRKGLRTLAGAIVTGSPVYAFDTGGPSVVDAVPADGSGNIDESQVFLLALDAGATVDSVSAAAYCEIEGLGERIGVDVLTGAARERVLTAELRETQRYFFQRFSDHHSEREGLVALQCRRSFPPDTAVTLVWGAGIATASGLVTAEAQPLSFRTRAVFDAQFQCERVNARAECVPFLPMSLVFSAPVALDQASMIRLVGNDGSRYEPESLDPAKSPTVNSITFRGPFPAQSKFEIQLPPGLTDDSGRALTNAARFPLEVATDEYPPLAKFSGEFGVIEAKEGGILPVTLRNLENPVMARRLGPEREAALPGRWQRIVQDDAEIIGWIKKVRVAAERRGEWVEESNGDRRWKELTGSRSVFDGQSDTTTFSIPKASDSQSFEVVGIPLQQPGFYVVELASPRLGAALLGEAIPRYVATSALVTNLAVHLKWGRERSLVWVTTLDSAKPVANAAIRVSQFCSGVVLWEGRTGMDGTAVVDGGRLPEPNGERDCSEWNESSPPLFVSARLDGDIGFSISGWNRGIQPTDFGLSTGSPYQSRVAHTVFDRTLQRAGETVSMKILLRERVMQGFAIPTDDPPDQIRIRHVGSGENYHLPASFDEQGIAEAAWNIPRDAKLGTYEVQLYRGDQWVFDSGQFQVQQFRVPSMRGSIQPVGEPWVNVKDVAVDLFVGYMNGGGAKGLPVKLRTQIRPRTLSYPDYADYSFGGEEVTEGIQEVDEEEEEQDSAAEPTPRPVRVVPLTLDRAGAARASIPELPPLKVPHELVAELEYQDANGERLTVAQNMALWPARLSLGLRTEGWVASRNRLRFQALALDLAGRPVAGKPVRVELLAKTTFSYRKRLIGGFYAYDNKAEVKRLDAVCEGTTDRVGLIACDLAPGVSGEVILRATARDEAGSTALATREVWIDDGGDWWFDQGSHDRMDVIPERRSYENGETARLQVRSPFREATALVTVEREGVIDNFVTVLSGKSPVVEVPIRAHYAPNVYVSVLAVRGRVTPKFGWLKDLGRKLNMPFRDESVTALVDLNKPAYRFGVARLGVGWAPNRLDVRVVPERVSFKVREQANVRIAVKRADGGPLPASAELAFAAVDEGLLELRPNTSWRLLEEMMGQRGIEVYTATAQMQVVGKRHYGRKALPQGGGGGRQPARELFDTLLLWRGRVPLGATGEAELAVPLNDSLTTFRLTAVANAGAGLFGTGDGTIRTTQDLMLFSGLPPIVRQGDVLQAGMTLRNGTDRRLSARAEVKVSVSGLPPDSPLTMTPQTVTLEPGEAREVVWPVEVPAEAVRMDWELSAEELDGGSARDRLQISQSVIAAVPDRVHQATLVQLDRPLAMSVDRPVDALPGRGGIRLVLQERLGDDASAVRDHMAQYPYSCLEQRVSKAVALRERQLWDGITAEMPNYQDADGLLKYFPGDALRGSDVVTAYVLAIADEAGWSLPPAVKSAAIAGLKGFVQGRVVRTTKWAAPDLVLRKLAALEALSRYGAAAPEMLGSLSLDPKSWPNSAVIDWLNILQRVEGVPQRSSRLREARQILKSRFTARGTTMVFSEAGQDRLWWLMQSVDVDSVKAILALSAERDGRDDLPKIVAGALGRQTRGHWDTTVANAWGILALDKFTKAFQATPVTGIVEANLGGTRQHWSWTPEQRRGALDFPWPEGPAMLAVEHHGAGAPWATIQSRAALPLKQADFSGYSISRRIEPVVQQQPSVWTRGDVIRIRLDVDAQADMAWVVVDDPVPAGASILGTGLGRDSSLLNGTPASESALWPIYEERRFEAFRAYYDYVPKGKWTLDYTVRLNTPGRFALPPTRVEALYAPDIYGESPNPAMEIHGEP